MSVRILKHLPSSLLLGLCLSLPSAYLFAEDDILGQFLEHNLFTSSDPIEIFAESPIHPTNTQTITGGLILSSQSALVVNNKTGQILYQKNADRIMPIASISKLMSAMVVLDANLNMDEIVTITRRNRPHQRNRQPPCHRHIPYSERAASLKPDEQRKPGHPRAGEDLPRRHGRICRRNEP